MPILIGVPAGAAAAEADAAELLASPPVPAAAGEDDDEVELLHALNASTAATPAPQTNLIEENQALRAMSLLHDHAIT
jgi:hypothetical protein